jgi:DNA-binding transcriptional ArsR family regulator
MDEIARNAFFIRDAETLKVVSDPLRLKIFGLLKDRTMTAKQLAEALEVPQTRLYYHLNQLEALGLIRVAGTRVVAGIIEKRYRASAGRIAVDRALFSPGVAPGDTALETMLTAILDGVRDAVRESVRAGLVDPQRESPAEGGLVLGRVWLRLTRDEANELNDKLIALLRSYDLRHQEEEDADLAPYEALLALYPVATSSDEPEQDEDADA